MRLFILCLTMSFAASAGIAEAADERTSREAHAFDERASASDLHDAYVSMTLGNGAIHGKNVDGKRTMGWRSFEARFGTELGIPWSNSGKLSSQDRALRIDFVHYNEGHPDNHHRDGFALQAVLRQKLSAGVKAELGIGPYHTMDTTIINGTSFNDSNGGALLSLAVLSDIDNVLPGMHIRFALNHVDVPGAHSSNSLQVGIGRDFDAPRRPASSEHPWTAPWLGVAVHHAMTNHGEAEGAVGFSGEARLYEGSWAASILAVDEGDDNVRVDRRGIALQGWYVQTLDRYWSISAGIGPYFAYNERASDDPLAYAMIALQLERGMGKDWKLFTCFNRIHTFQQKNDRDLFRFGIMKRFGG